MTTINTCSLLILVVLATTAAVVCTSAPSPAPYPEPLYPCPWRKVPHPEDPFIQKLGKWAVDQQPYLHFDKVESAKLQGVGSCTKMTHDYYYELIIDASLRGDFKYMVVVYVVNFTQPQKVMSITAIPPQYRPPAPAPGAN